VREELERRAQEQQDRSGQSPLPEHDTAATTTTGAIHNPNVLPPAPALAITQTHLDLALNEWLAEHSSLAPRPVQSRAETSD
jgi:hypothetical protein